MLIPLKWLEQIIGEPMAVEEIKKCSLSLGLEVEDMKRHAPDHAILAKIVAIKPHDKLKNLDILKVNAGQALTIVTAAKNIKVNDLVLVIPAGKSFNKTKVLEKDFAGVKSKGILISEQELGLAEKSTGVIIMEKGEPGDYFKDVFDDIVLDMSTTPNRPDWLSVQGIAQELAIGLGAAKNSLLHKKTHLTKQVNHQGGFRVEIKDWQGCPRYTARIFDNIEVKDSPFWLKWRLHCMGMNPVNNIVDITNLIMLLTGQPLHPFDLNLLNGRIIIRRAKKDEVFTTLEGTEFRLNNSDCVIADNAGVVALAGIIGAMRAQISDNTEQVLLESAYFDPKRIAHTSRRLELLTEASMRFEQGADIFMVDQTSAMTVDLFKKYCNAKQRDYISVGKKSRTTFIKFTLERLNNILSIDLTATQVKNILKKLNISVTGNKTLLAKIPHYRRDLKIEEDVFEEVARVYGYMNIPEIMPKRWGGRVTINKHRIHEKALRNYLVGQGFSETYNLSLLASERLSEFGFTQFVKLKNPLNERFNALRPTLFLGLLDCVNYNLSKGNKSLKLFEIGNILLNEKPFQEKKLGLILGGERFPGSWDMNNDLMDYYDAKGVVESIFELLHIKNVNFRKGKKKGFSHAVDIIISGKDLGYIGCVDKNLCKDPFYYIEISWNRLITLTTEAFYIPPARFPASIRDLSFLVDKNTAVPDITNMISQVGGPILEKIMLFDYYQGKNLPQNRKNLGFRLYFRAPDRTLTDREVDIFIQKIEHDITEKFNARLRKKE